MSLRAAASGLVVFLLSVSVIQGHNDWGVTYTSTEICALKGSTVEISCTYRYPSRINDRDTKVEETIWFVRLQDEEPVDVRTDSEYSGRVEYHCDKNDCSLRIRDVRESDSAEYKFRFITNQSGGRFTGSPGVTLSVTALQLQVIRKTVVSQDVIKTELKCHSSCSPAGRLSYVWYQHGEKLHEGTSSYSDSFHPSDSLSCAVKGLEDFPSPSECVHGQTCNRVMYTDRSICAFKGSSVDTSCTYNSYESIRSKFWFSPERSRRWQNPSQPEDLSKDSQYAGRVQVLETERGRSTLRIRVLRESDSAQYHFTFKTPSFEWRSSLPATTLTVTALQVQVIRLTVHQFYTEAELKCHSSCSPAGRLSYVWVKNGEKNMTEEKSTYKGLFYPGDNISCALKGHEDFPSPSVYALKLPSVSVSPSAEIVEGSSVNLTCSSDANPAANYTWYKKNGNITSVSKEPQLVFRSIQSSDSGEYYCTAENELGPRMSEYISINVKYAPKLPSVSVSPSAEIVEGSSVTLTCSSDANPAAKYTWYKENQTLIQGPEDTYHFTSISSKDRGIYHCKSENQHGQSSSESVFIDVQYPPKIPSVSVSPSAEIVEGSSVTLTCSSDANPAANYTWYKENEDSPKASGQIFTITDFRAEHSGNYYCEAQDSRGRRNSKLHLIGLPGTFNGTTIAVVLTVVLAVILISVFILIRILTRKKHGEKRDDKNQCQQPEQDDLHYASVEFSNIEPAQRHRHKQEDEENVEYAAVKVKSGSTAARKKRGEKRDDRNQGQRPKQEDLHYASVEFSNNKPAQHRRHKQENEENVEYAGVNVKSGSTAARNQESAGEDLAAVYSKVNKPC